MSNEERVKLTYDLADIPREAEAAKKAMESLRGETVKVDKAAETTAKGGANLSNALRDTGRVVQDVVSSGQISSAANNMEQFAASLGLGAGVGAGLQIILTLAPVAIGLLKSFANVGETKPPALDMMDRVNQALGDAKERLDKLKESWTGATGEAEAYAKAAADVVRLEKEANDERDRRAKLDAMRKAEASANAGETPESAKKAAEVIRGAGGTDAVLGQLTPQFIANYGGFIQAMDRVKKTTETMNRRLSEESDPINQAAVREFYGNQMKADQAAVAKTQQEAEAKARDLLARGGSGDQGALEELNKRLPNAGFFGATNYAINHQKEVEATVNRDQEQAKRQADAEAKAAEDRRKAGPEDQRAFEAGAYKHVLEQRRVEGAAGKVVGDLADGLERVSEAIDKDLKRGAREIRGNDYSGLVRDVEADQFGGLGLSGKQVDQIAEEVGKASAAGVDPMYAAAGAIQRLLDANALLMQRYGELNQQFNQYAAQARQQVDAVRTPMRRVW